MNSVTASNLTLLYNGSLMNNLFSSLSSLPTETDEADSGSILLHKLDY
jgi:hypothetical protein